MDTICALTTGADKSAVAIIRVSGKASIDICKSIVSLKSGTLTDAPQAKLLTAALLDNQRVIDNVMVSVFHAPASFTGENVVEINCHGSPLVISQIINLLIKKGCRMGKAGEFSKRAFLNGKMDLLQAEAICDLINSQTNLQSSLALYDLSGAMSKKISDISSKLISINTDIMAYVDFPDEGLGEYDPSSLLARLVSLQKTLSKLADGFEHGRLIKDGVNTAIIGTPNVGKSTLMNRILGYNRSITSPNPGTTRDMISEPAVMGGIRLNLMDTAGIRADGGEIELMGVAISKQLLHSSPLLFCLFDGSVPLTEQDLSLIKTTRSKPAIAIINKSDLPQLIDSEYISSNYKHVVYISAKNGEGIEEIDKRVKEIFQTQHTAANKGEIIMNARHYERICAGLKHLQAAITAIQDGFEHDLVSTDITAAAAALGEITGAAVSEQMIDQIFSKFCVGK